MSRKKHRSGGKFGGSHTTLINAALIVADIADAQCEVTKILASYIKSGLPPAQGQRRVKISDREGNVLLAVRDNTSHQLVVVYTSDSQKTKLAIAKGARNAGLHVSFATH